jgi:3'(2'), 5'-bisphosphate nucleotidase
MTDDALAESLAEEAGRLLVDIRASWHWDGGADAAELGREGDRASNDLLVARLQAERPGDATLSEEAPDDPARLAARRVWIVDPLDGTREFSMRGRRDWAVHVALWESGAGITAAAVALPAQEIVFSTAKKTSRCAPQPRDRPVIVVSESRTPAVALSVAKSLGAEVLPMGSAGAKAMAVVSGEADAYVHEGAMKEWDCAAPAAVAAAAGLHVSRFDGSALRYNQRPPAVADLVICVPAMARALLGALR